MLLSLIFKFLHLCWCLHIVQLQYNDYFQYFIASSHIFNFFSFIISDQFQFQSTFNKESLTWYLILFEIPLNWLHYVESLSSSWVLDSLKLDSSQNFEIKYLSWVRILISSIWIESWCWYQVLTQIFDSTHQNMIYYY